MSLLHDKALHRALAEKDWSRKLVVTPLLEISQVGEASIDLRLGNEFLLLRRTLRPGVQLDEVTFPESADPTDLERRARHAQAGVDELYEEVVVPFGEGLWLHPQQFALGATFEYLRLPAMFGANVLSRSTWGRLGLLVATAVMVQPGFTGTLTLELVNESDSPVKLFPGIKNAQLVVYSVPTSEPVWTEADEETHDQEFGHLEPKEPTYKWPTGPQAAVIKNDYVDLNHIRRVGRALAEI